MNFEGVSSNEEKKPVQSDPDFESKDHGLTIDEILVHLKKDLAFQELWNNETVLREKADLIQQVLDQMMQEEENKGKDPHKLYYQASMAEGIAPDQEEKNIQFTDPFLR